jgi:hypothetical protein
MARTDSSANAESRVVNPRGRFLRWELVDSSDADSRTLTNLGPVTVRFSIEIDQSVGNGQHGVALFSADRQLIWAWAAENVKLEIGLHHLYYTFPMLPLRPGPYFWQVSFYDDSECIDAWDCLPEMVVATETHQHQHDQWNGILNMPSRFEIDVRS